MKFGCEKAYEHDVEVLSSAFELAVGLQLDSDGSQLVRQPMLSGLRVVLVDGLRTDVYADDRLDVSAHFAREQSCREVSMGPTKT